MLSRRKRSSFRSRPGNETGSIRRAGPVRSTGCAPSSVLGSLSLSSSKLSHLTLSRPYVQSQCIILPCFSRNGHRSSAGRRHPAGLLSHCKDLDRLQHKSCPTVRDGPPSRVDLVALPRALTRDASPRQLQSPSFPRPRSSQHHGPLLLLLLRHSSLCRGRGQHLPEQPASRPLVLSTPAGRLNMADGSALCVLLISSSRSPYAGPT